MSLGRIFHPIGENVTVMSHVIDYVEPLSFSFVFSLCIGFLYILSYRYIVMFPFSLDIIKGCIQHTHIYTSLERKRTLTPPQVETILGLRILVALIFNL